MKKDGVGFIKIKKFPKSIAESEVTNGLTGATEYITSCKHHIADS